MTEHLVSARIDESGRGQFDARDPIVVMPGDTITVSLAPAVGERITMEVTEYPPWWAFWRKPKRVVKPFVITASLTAD